MTKRQVTQGRDKMARLIPCKEPVPNLPKRKRKKPPVKQYEDWELFGFDTETTRCGKKELRSYQAVWEDKSGNRYGFLAWLNDWYSVKRIASLDISLRNQVDKYTGTVIRRCTSLGELRQVAQQAHEEIMYEGQPRNVKRAGRWRRSGRTVKRCAVAYNGNFDYGAMADYTELVEEMESGTMQGAGVRYIFRSAEESDDDSRTGMRIEALYLGARSVPFTLKRGELWDIAPVARELWGARNLRGCGKKIGLDKMEPDFNCPVYGMIDALVTLKSAQQLTADLKGMGFQGAPDRFISGATVSKDVMSQHYQPFYLSQAHHEFVWPAYFGGMTGPTHPSHAHNMVEGVLYGDLDGAYNASGQNLKVFDWDGARDVDPTECRHIIEVVQSNPSQFWKYGSLHLRVKGNFHRCPVRVATVGSNNDANPTTSSGLVWATMKNYETTLTLGDFLHCEIDKVKILGGLMATSTPGRGPCIFKMTADERAKHKSGTIGNQWWKLAGNAAYGVLANRNGKNREQPGPFFNALMASSITGAIRHCIWVCNEAANGESFYNDTDSCMLTPEAFKRAQKALEPLKIGFSNKTDDELDGCDVASIAVIHGSKRYAMEGPNGEFGAKCHGLGAWWCYLDGRVVSVAHNEKILKAVWQIAYPEYFGECEEKYRSLAVFHKFSIRTHRMATLVRRYAQRQFDIPLREVGAYGRAGNFGFIAPGILDGELNSLVAYEPEEAVRLSVLDLEDVAMLWGNSWDKKFDYGKSKPWAFMGSEVRTVEPIGHTQALIQSQQDTLEGDISISEVSIE